MIFLVSPISDNCDIVFVEATIVHPFIAEILPLRTRVLHDATGNSIVAGIWRRLRRRNIRSIRGTEKTVSEFSLSVLSVHIEPNQ